MRDGFSAWAKTDPETILRRHIVNAKGAKPAFREAPERKHSRSHAGYRFDTGVPSPLTELPVTSTRKRRSCRKTHCGEVTITLQESIEYLDHEFLTHRFHVTHYGGYSILFDKDTFHPNIKVTSVYLHDTGDDQQHDVQGESGCVLQGVISRASFRRLPHNGKSFFTMMSLHINNQLAKKRGIGKKLLLTIRAAMPVEHVDWVAGDFNGCCLAPPMWQRSKNPPVSSKKPLPIQTCRCHLAPQHCGAQVQCQVNRLTRADFSSHRTLMKVESTIARCVFYHHSTLGIREKDQSCHHEVLDAPGTC